MGRPKGSSNKTTAETPKSEPKVEPSISKAAAVRAALADGLDRLDDIAEYVKAKHGHDIPKTMLSAYKSGEKKKTAETAPKPVAEKKAKPVAPQVAKHGGGGETDLITAMEAIKP
jgi:hypothetical protein